MARGLGSRKRPARDPASRRHDKRVLSLRQGPRPKPAEKAAPSLVDWNDIPDWYQDNRFIRSGYRPVSGSARESFASWSYMHNETINIYTHLIPAVAFALGSWYLYEHLQNHYPDVTITDYLVFSFFIATAVTCLGLSTTYHTLMNHSSAVESFWLRMDFVGIVLLTLDDLVSVIYMVYWCERQERNIYWAMIGTLSATSIYVMLSPGFQSRKWRTIRTLTFVCTGLSGFVPLVHGVKMFGVSQMMKQSGMPYYLVEGSFLIVGAIVYGTRFPERLSPGTFDTWGSPHQVFHVLVVLATVTQLIGVLSAYDYNYHHRICGAP
ncbi:mPR-like GPCR protein [Xylariomycetidae sp. FL0641]|nr:mPR-like GPCR protein [Xylariomycetidae sp. FL0641]